MSLQLASKSQFSIKRKTSEMLNLIKQNKISYLFLAPYALIFTIFTVIPVVTSIYISFTYYNILEAPKWVGLQNYINLILDDEIFLIAVKNTFLFAAITGPVGYFAALFFAWMINELNPKIRALMVLIFYAPSISGQAYIVWATLFSGDTYGYLNGILLKLGLIHQPIQWLTNPEYMHGALIVVILWMSLGAGFLAFIAGLQSIDRSLYEAGYVDGVRNRWQELWYITLPAMKPQLLFGAVMSITSSFAIHEILVPLAGFPSTDYAAHTVVSHLVDYGSVRFEMGYASAIATLLFFVMISVNKIVQRLLRKVGN